MKKTFIIFLTALSVAVSCKKPVDDGRDIDLSGHTVFNVNTEQIDIVPGSSFRSTWPEGAQIGVFGGTGDGNVRYFLKRSGVGAAEAVFYGPKVDGESCIAYYPYSEFCSLEDGRIPCTLPSVQTYSAERTATEQFLGCCGTVVAAADGNGVLGFRYPFGLVAVRICFDDVLTVKGMTLSSRDRGISGRMLADGQASVVPSSVSSGKIELAFSQPVVSKDASGNFTTFYFVLPPAEYASKTLTLDIDAQEGKMSVMMKSVRVERVQGMDFPVTNVNVDASDLPGFNPVDGYLE